MQIAAFLNNLKILVQKVVPLVFCFMLLNISNSLSQEITAVDFNGDLLGKVIPDGKVVSFNNQLIGNVTADSLIINFEGKLIGGVIPQGVAIGNDLRFLGKVSSDGSVRLPSGQIVGKVLPSGLVVNDYFDIIGAVVFPGLVYSDDGKTIGRVSGDGLYVNLQGQQIGIITPDGYAYRRVGNDYVLEGQLISSKMVVSPTGEFVGSVVPGGNVSDFNSEIIGYIHANGYAYNEQNQVIGHIVRTGYAFDDNGYYLGFVSYNGEVIKGEKLVGKLRADGLISDSENKIIGFKIDINATATNLSGNYLGRIMPEGNLAKSKNITSFVGARGVVLGSNGMPVGQISSTGPVFDYKGSLIGHAMPGGSVVSLKGSSIGYMINEDAFDTSGKLLGSVLKDRLIFSENSTFSGVSGINSYLGEGDNKTIISPYGYVFNQSGNLIGNNLIMSPLYMANGIVSSYMNFNGLATNSIGSDVGRIVSGGWVLDDQNKLSSKNNNSFYTIGYKEKDLGMLTQNNLLLSTSLNIVGKILPDNSVVESSKAGTVNYMPVIGYAYSQKIALDFKGQQLGYVNILGNVNNFNSSQIGKVVERGLVVDNNNILIGFVQGYQSVVNENCEFLGVMTPRGDVQNFRGVYIGNMLSNSQTIDGNGQQIGFAPAKNPIVDDSGKIIGFPDSTGRVWDFENKSIGCLNKRGYLFNADGFLIGKSLDYETVIDFSGNIIGRSVLDGSIIDKNERIIGYQQTNGNVNNLEGLPIGMIFKYKIAFNLDNKFIGRVLPDGSVVDSNNSKLGKVNFEGYVISDNQKIGYALYDSYVYNEKGDVIGVIGRNGEVVDFKNQNIGHIERGFLVDASQNMVGRGNRDYNIRESSKLVLGELNFKGDVVNSLQLVVGKISSAGEIINKNKEKIAQAYPLQYYSKVAKTFERKMIFDKDGKFIGYLDENGNIVDKDGNVIATEDNEGNAVDKEGNIIGSKINNRPVYDKNGNVIGLANEEGNVIDANGKTIGKINQNGDAIDASGNIIGGINSNWYEKTPQPPTLTKKDDDINPALKLLESSQHKKSLGIALTPDGEYLGEILEDGSVVNKEGKVVGRRMPDGLVIDDDGTLIGIEEIKRSEGEGSGIFVPPGTFGQGGAYGTGEGSPGNLGPGGGYGPGERYDPIRQAALNTAMNERRKNIAVGKISSGIRKEAFDGMQKDWSEQGIPKIVSSWRVDLSEMIFADKPIPAVISRAIDSNNPAPITAFVERNVYAEEGRNVIIPAGSRLVGTLGSVTATTEATSESARVQISWERLIRPDGSLFVLQGLTADAQGRGGALGYVDQQLFKKYTLPVMTTSLTSATSYFMAPNSESSTENETPRQQAANDARQNFLNEMNQVFDEILADKSNIRPMTYIPAGTRIIVFPNADLWLRTVERDQESSVLLEKPKVFLDDGEETAKRETRQRESKQKVVSSAETGGDVVYDPDTGDVDSANNKPIPLISSSDVKNKNSKSSSPSLVPPPPPPSSAVNSSSIANTGGGGATTNNGVPALF